MKPTYTVRLDLATAFAPIDRCPTCGSSTVNALADGEHVRYQCPACDTWWRVEAGRVIRAGRRTRRDPRRAEGQPEAERLPSPAAE